MHADQFVGGARDPRLPPLWRDRHGEHHPGGAVRPRDLAGGPGCGPGGDAVVDHHGGPASQWLARPADPVTRGAGVYLCLLAGLGTWPTGVKIACLRPHQSRKQRPPLHESGRAVDVTARIKRTHAVQGLISEYRRAA